ncbi:MAG: hypothetical protein JKY37_21300 [Nannocystaceae bacterium]|nr:hypothetical protein [Nannocystaceae bacterium]
MRTLKTLLIALALSVTISGTAYAGYTIKVENGTVTAVKTLNGKTTVLGTFSEGSLKKKLKKAAKAVTDDNNDPK